MSSAYPPTLILKKRFRSKDISTSLLPPPDTWHHPILLPQTPNMKDRILDFLNSVNIAHTDISTDTSTELEVKIKGNTWSRAARRATKQQDQNNLPTSHEGEEIPHTRAILLILNDMVELEWMYGSNRADIDSFWKSMLVKVGLINRAGTSTSTGTSGEKRPPAVERNDGEGGRKAIKLDT
jgi:hypothetical protein